jgi:hypothetical protein
MGELSLALSAGRNARSGTRRPRSVTFAVLLLGLCAGAGAQSAGGAWQHRGPGVGPGTSGPLRFVSLLKDRFSSERAMADAAFADRFYRTPGGEGYDATLDHFAARLREAGYGEKPGFELTMFESELEQPSWTPKGALIVLVREGEAEEVLHQFEKSEDVDRVVLPMFTPSADVGGPPVFNLGEVTPGSVLVTEARANASLIQRASERGAVAILSSALNAFSEDPTGKGRHENAILFTKVPPELSFPVAQISPRSHARIAEAAAKGKVEVGYHAEVVRGSKKVRTLCATVCGSRLSEEAVAIASHVQEPGAGDNASGNAGLVECACALAGLIREKGMEPPARSIVFIWGDEFRQSRVWLEKGGRRAIAAISADMLGQSTEQTGAIALLERMQDPGALVTIPPDDHTPWGAGKVSEEDFVPNGLALVARTAFADVASVTGGWVTAENPWEGGSDHDVFLEHGIPAVLIWHFTDFTYHTSLDRMDMLDPMELERSCLAVLATALAIASPAPGDLERYLATNEIERGLRVAAAKKAGHSEIADRWELWCKGAELWLRELCTLPEKH